MLTAPSKSNADAAWRREGLRQERLAQPQLLVEAPTRIVDQDFASLPPGIHLAPGRITVEFEEPQEALEKLLALAMAMGGNFEEFERSTKNRN